jgi:HEAT repeat protein
LGRLGDADPTEQVVPALIARLGDGDGDVLRAAAEALGRLGDRAALRRALDTLAEEAHAPANQGTGREDDAFRVLMDLLPLYTRD